MAKINDTTLYRKLIENVVESEFKDSIERGEITKELATYFVAKYCTFDVQPVIQVDDYEDGGINPQVIFEVKVNFDKLYDNLGLSVKNEG